MRQGLWKRARIGAAAGIRLGLFYAVMVTIIVPLENTRHQLADISLLGMLLGCLLFMPLGGAIINIARPWIRDIFGAALTGCAVFLPIVLTIALSSRGLHGWSIDFAFTTALLIFLFGTVFGSVFWLSRSRYRGNWWDGE